MKKIFHRHKDDSPTQSTHRRNVSAGDPGDPSLPGTPYASVSSDGSPEIGTSPYRGSRDAGSRALGDLNSSNRSPPTQQYPDSPTAGRLFRNAPPDSGLANRRPIDGRVRGLGAPVAQEISGLNLGNSAEPSGFQKRQDRNAYVSRSPAETQEPSSYSTGGFSATDMRDPQYAYMNAVYGDRNRIGQPQSRPSNVIGQGTSTNQQGPANTSNATELAGRDIYSNNTSAAPPNSTQRYQPDESMLPGRKPVPPRKEVGLSFAAPTTASSSLPPQFSNGPQQSRNTRKSSVASDLVDDTTRRGKSNNMPPKALKTPSGPTTELAAEEVLRRAKGNTTDTEVIEAIAPAVTHETVRQELHHVREEVITREIHNHDVYHRILPIIDVEVLPPRHFLPVEGGGLVEVSADEVPSRGRNWVIAETASKIPTDEHAPPRTNRFTAREFVGTEGDFKRYTTREGFERTEETWIHPPELETGGRDTGQTWPMEFGTKSTHTRHRSSSAKAHKSKSPRKAPMGPRPTPAPTT